MLEVLLASEKGQFNFNDELEDGNELAPSLKEVLQYIQNLEVRIF
jgi:hypothetical protein